MNWRDLFGDTLRTLWAHKLRTALTMFGIAWGVVSIILMNAAGEGLREGQLKTSRNFGRDLMIIFSGRTSLQAGGARAGRAIRWQRDDYLYVTREAPDCQYVLPEFGRGIKVYSQYNSASLLVVGSLPTFTDLRSITVAEGRFYNDEDVAMGRRVAFLGSDAKKQLFNTRNALGESIRLNGLPYVIIGVMKEKDQDSSYDGRDVNKVFVPFSTIMQDFPEPPPSKPTDIDQMLASPRSLDVHESCKWQVRKALARLHHFDPHDEEAAMIWDTVENQMAFRRMTDSMKYFLGGVGVITLLLGGLGVMNVMLVAVRERTREIGIRKAVGATSGAILRQFLVESMIIVLLSGSVGLAIAFTICSLINLLPMPEFFSGMLPTWTVGLVSVTLLGLVAVLAALYPASRAAAVDPIEALRFEAGN